MTITRKILFALLAVFIIIQFFRPEKNESSAQTPNDIFAHYKANENTKQLIRTACYDCHSNNTVYPWYSNLQPAAWFLSNHVKDGKKHLNFSEFTNLPIAVQNHKLEEIIEEVQEKEMPLASYTYIGLHANAKLNDRNIFYNSSCVMF